jgi:RNA-binding protein YhbY
VQTDSEFVIESMLIKIQILLNSNQADISVIKEIIQEMDLIVMETTG